MNINNTNNNDLINGGGDYDDDDDILDENVDLLSNDGQEAFKEDHHDRDLPSRDKLVLLIACHVLLIYCHVLLIAFCLLLLGFLCY